VVGGRLVNGRWFRFRDGWGIDWRNPMGWWDDWNWRLVYWWRLDDRWRDDWDWRFVNWWRLDDRWRDHWDWGLVNWRWLRFRDGWGLDGGNPRGGGVAGN